MVRRLINLSTIQSLFLFGARGTGKTSLIKTLFLSSLPTDAIYIDLLNLDTEAKYQLNPESLYKELSALPSQIKTVVIDEIQKNPKLLDVVHRKIEESQLRFILTGSSARKLKLGAANLLAGRAVVFHLYPLLALELQETFNLHQALSFGTLPRVVNLSDPVEKKRSLLAYANTYLKEEVWNEQLIRRIEPFRRFLQIAAQTHGQQINYSKVARDTGVDDSTVKSYYAVLEDTLVGFFLPSYAGSERKKLAKAPKFFLFDNGVKRALDGSIDYDLQPGTAEYGVLFEQFVVSELTRRISYLELNLAFSFLRTTSGAEIDLVIERVGKVIALVEIKSGTKVDNVDIRYLTSLAPDFMTAKCFCLYGGNSTYQEGGVRVVPWLEGVTEIVDLLRP